MFSHMSSGCYGIKVASPLYHSHPRETRRYELCTLHDEGWASLVGLSVSLAVRMTYTLYQEVV